jgi:serine/threonine-protein kinase
VVLGTPFYMSPEQAQALPNLDARTDLWSVGAILYECLAGKPPHVGDAYEQIIISICTTEARDIRSFDPTIPEPLAALVHRALTRDRARRFQTAKEMLDALVSTGISVPSLAMMTPRTVVQVAPPGPALPVDGAPAPTRVSWTTGEPRAAALAGAVTEIDKGRSARAQVVRRRGLVVLGVAVTLAAFILTTGFLRARRTGRAVAAQTKLATVAATASSAPAAAPSSLGADTAAPEVRPAADVASPAVRPPAAAPLAPPSKGKRASSATPIAAAPVPPSAPSSAAPAKPGVAGGLQIKTNYP